jgi:membrane protein DedA with SNARE-associated domain
VDAVVELAREILELIRRHELVALFVAILVEDFGIPLPAPGDLIVAFFASHHRADPLSIVYAVLAATVATTIGANGPYLIARKYGRGVISRLERWLDLDPSHVERAEGWLAQRGLLALIALRALPGLRLPAALLAGASWVPFPRYVLAIAVAALVYWSIWALVGATVGGAVERLLEALNLRFIAPLVALAGFLAILVRAFTRARE